MYEEVYREFRKNVLQLAREFQARDREGENPMSDEEFWDTVGDAHLVALATKSRIKRKTANQMHSPRHANHADGTTFINCICGFTMFHGYNTWKEAQAAYDKHIR